MAMVIHDVIAVQHPSGVHRGTQGALERPEAQIIADISKHKLLFVYVVIVNPASKSSKYLVMRSLVPVMAFSACCLGFNRLLRRYLEDQGHGLCLMIIQHMHRNDAAK